MKVIFFANPPGKMGRIRVLDAWTGERIELYHVLRDDLNHNIKMSQEQVGRKYDQFYFQHVK